MKVFNSKGRTPVLFVLPTLGTGGSEKVVLDLCSHLADSFLPVVASFRGGALEDEISKAGVQVNVLHRRGGIDFMLVIKLWRLIHKYNIKIVNTHHFVSLFYAFLAAKFAKIPILHIEHSRWEMEALSPIWKRCFKFFLKRIACVGTVSKAAYDYIAQFYIIDKKRLALFLNGIDVELFEESSYKPVTRESLGLQSQDMVVGTVGNLRPEKNQKLLIQALAVLKEQSEKVRAVFIGDGPCRFELEKLAKELGIGDEALFLGSQKDIHRFYGIFDIYCLTSKYEGLPLTLLEAMAAGVPVIGTNVLGIQDIIRDGENGILVTDDDPCEISRAIMKLAHDKMLRHRLKVSGRRLVKDQYNLSLFVDNYERQFRLLANDLG